MAYSGALRQVTITSVLVLVVVQPAFAATFTVDSTADATDAMPGDGVCNDGTGNCTLRAAIQEANAFTGDDTINVPTETYTLTLGSEITISSGITLHGAGTDATFVQAAAAPNVATFRVFNVAAGNVAITDLTVRHGKTPLGLGGSGILVQSGTVTLDRVAIVDNTSVDHAAVSVWAGTLTLVNSVVHGNDGLSGQGGGIFNYPGGTVHVQQSTVTGNQAGFGGGISNFSGTLTVVTSTVAENTTTYGGGIANANGGSVELVNSDVLWNTSSQYGGGILNQGSLTVVDSNIEGNQGGGVYNQEGLFSLTRSTISGNSGSGIRNLGLGTVVAVNSTISGNSWTRTGGIYNFRGTVTLTHCTISGNESTLGSGAGGVENNAGTLTLTGSILATNVSADRPDCSGSITSLGYNLVGNDLNCGFFPSAGDVVNVDPILGPLADNGGPTETHALSAGSPAIDAVPVADCTDAAGNPLTTDQRGVARPQGAACDIGAYEFGTPPNTPPLADAGNDSEMECTSPNGAMMLLNGSGSTDPDSTPGTNDDIVLFEWFEDFGLPSEAFLGESETLDVVLPLGSHVITLRVTDTAGATDTDDVVKSVVDTVPPEIDASVDPDTLWPPNHRMLEVEASVIASDLCSIPEVILADVTSDEPDNAPGTGDGNTDNDIQGADIGTEDYAILLRAERAGTGDGRTYTVSYTATDTSGNEASAGAFVEVPHDLGGKTDPVEVTAGENESGTVIRWSAVEGATHYTVIRGRLDDIVETTSSIDLGAVLCIEASSFDVSTEGWEDAGIPGVGEVFFYLVEYDDGFRSSYGTESASKPRVSGTGECW